MSGSLGVVFFVDYASTTTTTFTINAVDAGIGGTLVASTAYAFTYNVAG
jgi:hypothetical protein